jgi:hypothetical protein
LVGAPLRTCYLEVAGDSRTDVHLQELAVGYEKDPQKLEEQLAVVRGWQQTVQRLAALLHS